MKYKLIFFAILLLAFSQVAFANELPLNVVVNEDYFGPTELLEEVEGRLYVPVRPFAEAFGGQVAWLPEERTTRITFGEVICYFSEGENLVDVGGAKEVLEAKTLLRDGVLKVELRPLVTFLGGTLTYDMAHHAIFVHLDNAQLGPQYIGPEPNRIAYSDEDLFLLARLIHVESQGGSLYRSLAVANVILNRVKSPQFPSTIIDVIYQKGQFPPTQKDSFAQIQPEQTAFRAALMALNGYNNIEDCLYFNHRPFKWKDKSDLFRYFEGMYFYR